MMFHVLYFFHKASWADFVPRYFYRFGKIDGGGLLMHFVWVLVLNITWLFASIR